MKKTLMIVVWAAAVPAMTGCYKSANTDAGSDPHTDPLQDPAPDPHYDPGFDPVPDPYTDPWYDPPPDPVWDPVPDMPPDPIYDVPPDGPMVCPPHGPVFSSFVVDHDAYPMEYREIEQRCMIEAVMGEDEGHTIIELSCWADTGELELHTVEIMTSPPAYIFMWEGEPVLFRYVVRSPWWSDKWFSISYDWGAMAMAGVDAADILPYGTDPDGWYGQLDLSLIGGLCPWTPGHCGDEERMALDVSFYGTGARFFDGSTGMVGLMESYQVFVEQAVVYHNVTCDDFAESWFRALFVYIPEG
jgi:hypothetical protein